MFDVGTWYFDKWTHHYVQVVAGAQREGHITVAGSGHDVDLIYTCPIGDLDLNRSRRIETMVGPPPVELEDDGKIDFVQVAPDVWQVAEGDQGKMQSSIDDALQRAFGKTMKELFPE